MDNKQWQQLEKLFGQAAELPPEKQLSFIKSNTEENSELRRQLEHMLLKSDSNSIVEIIGRSANHLIQSQPPKWMDDIERYKVLRLIAQGGMGSVYLAERRDSEFEQNVAIKVHNTPLTDPNSKTRFLRERQILADFNHPNIAKLIDGGTSAEGTPYLIMEYISGLPIDQYCDNHKLDLKQRIKLLKKVCSAVNYAHQHLIIHRDIKPSNIIVDERGEPYLLDFGIAKTVGEHLEDNFLLTQTHHRILTPEIASPEQIRGQTVSPATDVYGLGVLLYKLVTGSYPFQIKKADNDSNNKNIESSYQKLETLVCTMPPKKPTTQLRNNTKSKTNPVYNQSINIVLKEIQGDLENIILKTLRKHPGNRYLNCEHLANDLQRYLDNQPVLAKPQTIIYRSKKVFQRHPVASLATLAVVILMTTTVGIYTVKLKAQKEIAEQRLVTSKAVTQLLISSFEVSDPNESLGNKITARQILDQGALQLETQTNVQPEVQSHLRSVIGQVYLSLGIFSKAEELLNTAYLENEQSSEEVNENSIQLQLSLGKLQSLTSRYKLAEETLLNALKQSTSHLGELKLLTGEIISVLIANAIEFENYQLAKSLLQDNLEKFTNALPQSHPLPFKLLEQKIALLLRLGLVADSIQLATKSHQKSVKLLGEKHRQTLNIHKQLGHTYFVDHQFEKALASYFKDFKSDQEIYGLEHYTSVGHLIDLGATYHHLDDSSKAIDYNLRAIEVGSRLLGENHADVADAYNNLGLVYREKGKYHEAVKAIDQSRKINEINFGPESKEVATNYNNLGSTYNILGQYELAEENLMRALDIREKKLGHYSEQTAYSYNHIGAFYYSQKNYVSAAKYFKEVIEIRDKILTENSPIKIQDKATLAIAYIRMKNYLAAEALLKSAISGDQDFYQQSSHAHYYARLVESQLLAAQNECAKAERKFLTLISDASKNMAELPSYLTRPNDLLEQCKEKSNH